jgi:ABC-type multidrug transport system fused ATPase/permease subunit
MRHDSYVTLLRRQPLNVIPTWIVQILRAKVSLERIAVYLQEDEVTSQVSSLKKEVDLSSNGEGKGFGLKNATMKWNIVEQEEQTKDVKGKGKSVDANSEREASPSSDTSSTVAPSDADHHFELKDISVMFPEGQLSLITGPTARYNLSFFISSQIIDCWKHIAGRLRCLWRFLAR